MTELHKRVFGEVFFAHFLVLGIFRFFLPPFPADYCSSGFALMFLPQPAVHPALISGFTERGRTNYRRFYLFISVLLLSFCCFVSRNLSNALELIEYVPLTAVWNNEASFPSYFLPRDGVSLLHFGPHQRVLSVWNLRLKELLITLRARSFVFTTSVAMERCYYWARSFQSQETTAVQQRCCYLT